MMPSMVMPSPCTDSLLTTAYSYPPPLSHTHCVDMLAIVTLSKVMFFNTHKS
jgi:hypothetical protein